MRMAVVQLQAGYYQTGEFEVCDEYKLYLEQDPRDAPLVHVKTVNEMKLFLHSALADPTKDIPHPSIPSTNIPRQRQTVAKIAELIHANGNVQLMATDNRFMVMGLNGKKYTVTLGPNMECECGRPKCEHLRAALYKCGFVQDFGSPQRIPRKRVKKPTYRRTKGTKSGRKKPRAKDTKPQVGQKKMNITDFMKTNKRVPRHNKRSNLN